MSAFDAKRTYDKYLAFCTAFFAVFINFIYYLNYFCLNIKLTAKIWSIIKKNQQHSHVDVQHRSASKQKLNRLQKFLRAESTIHAILFCLFGK